ncbi:ribonuclease J [Patescibacteria group bacterium]|nr:ribonuclease J [Patescibacteria group bacterium]MBU1472352.1 ribonuclease J [Patescibacteria group bacterium]MBU2460396.1 ribonuclease J [Patescibacteria group bacterium]MBU2544223.1 ribonuclease J [Patescibacteria group bacterium]
MKFYNHNQKKPNAIFQGSSQKPSGKPACRTGRDSIRIIPLGGVGNVTKNMYVYEYRYDGKLQDILIVDCGIGFPEPEMYGVDLVIPDVRYLESKRDKIRGLICTHGHDDHIGGIPHVYQKLGKIPMWGTRLTAAFANIKLKEVHSKTFVAPVEFNQTLELGKFRVSFIRLTHSVPDTAHLVIETPIGVFYHGSDFKFDMTPLDGKVSELSKITAVGRRGVLCLLTDSLGSERRGFTPSEQVVGETLEKELQTCPGKLLFTTQSSNIARVQLAIELALKYHRKIAFLGRSIDQNVEAALKLDYMRFPREAVIRDRDLRKIPSEKQFLVVAGAQGQLGSALYRIAHDDHSDIKLKEGDSVVFSADPIPGHENDVNNVIDQIYHHGVRVSYSDIMEDLHVSGHGSQGDLILLLSALGPKYVMPIGGTYKHMMQYRRLAQDIGYDKKQILIPEEGEVLEFTRFNPPRVVDHVELENVFVDGLGVGDVGEAVLRDRQTIATEGIVVVVVPINKRNRQVTTDVEIISRGFVYMRQSKDLVARAKQVVRQSLRLKKGRIVDWQFIRRNIEESLGKFLSKETGRFPLVVPVIVET